MYDVVSSDLPVVDQGATEVLVVDFAMGVTPFFGYCVGGVDVVSVDAAAAVDFAPGVDHPNAGADTNLGDTQMLGFAVSSEDCGV